MTHDVLVLILISFGVGVTMGLTGMGGGALMTPALIFSGIPPTSAIANDLVAATINKTVGAATHWRHGSPNFHLAGWLIAGSTPTAFLGGFIVDAIGDASSQDRILKAAIGITLLIASLTYVCRMYLTLSRASNNANTEPQPYAKPIPTLIIGAVGGLFVGITSVGSGSLIMVSLLILYPTLTAAKLVGTDLVQAVPLVLVAAISHVLVTGIDVHILIPLVVGGTPGTYLGSRLANRVSQSLVRRAISIVLALTGCAMLRMPPIGLTVLAATLVFAGPVAWGLLRKQHGLPYSKHIQFNPLRTRSSRKLDISTHREKTTEEDDTKNAKDT